MCRLVRTEKFEVTTMVHFFFLFIHCPSRNGVLVALGPLWGPAKGVFIICYLDGFHWWSLKRKVWAWCMLRTTFIQWFQQVHCILPSTNWSQWPFAGCVIGRLFWPSDEAKTSLVSRMNIIGVEISSNVFFFSFFFLFLGEVFGWQQQKIIVN